MGWTALLLAGQRPGVDPLAAHFGETWKALVPVRGQTMLSRVARTLLDCPSIDRIIVLAQAPSALTATSDTAWLAREPRIEFSASMASISQSVAGAAGTLAPWPVLVTTADHALLTPAMVEDFISGVGDADVAVALVERANLLGRYPGNKRTWLKFRGGAYSGANLFALTGERARRARAVGGGRAGPQEGLEARFRVRAAVAAARADAHHVTPRRPGRGGPTARSEGVAGGAPPARSGD